MGQAVKAFSNANKPRRHGLVKRIGLSAVMALSVGVSMVQAQTVNNVPATVTSPFILGYNPAPAPTLPQDLAAYVNDPADAPEIRALKNEFVTTELGISLMRFARDNGMRFLLDSTLGERHSKAEYDPATGHILIRPGQKLEALVIYTAHEIRHGWQDKVLGAPGMELGVMTPWQRWTLRRYMEADAEAFSAYFEADRLRSGAHLKPGFAEAMPASTLSMKLRGEFWSRNGLTFGEYRRLAFEPCLAALHTYNARQLDLVESMTLDFGKQVTAALNDKTKLAALETAVQKAPTDADFATFLRHFGGVSFDPTHQTSLQSRAVTDEMLLNDYPRRESNPKALKNFPAVLDGEIAKYTALQEGYIRVLHDASGVKPAPQPAARAPAGLKPGA